MGLENFPFEEEVVLGKRIRVFSGEVGQGELIWHRDDEDRIVKVLESDGWYFQRDNQLPQEIHPGDVITIARHEWHRILRRKSSQLVIEISTP